MLWNYPTLRYILKPVDLDAISIYIFLQGGEVPRGEKKKKKKRHFFISLLLYTIFGILMSFGFVFPKSKINDKSVLEQRSPDSESEHYSLHKCTQHAYYKELYAHWLLDLITA